MVINIVGTNYMILNLECFFTEVYILSDERFSWVILSNISGLHKKGFLLPFSAPLRTPIWGEVSEFIHQCQPLVGISQIDGEMFSIIWKKSLCPLPLILNQYELVTRVHTCVFPENTIFPLISCSSSRPVEPSHCSIAYNSAVRKEVNISFSFNGSLSFLLSSEFKREVTYWISQP